MDDYDINEFEEYLRRKDVREALHVGDVEFTADNDTARSKLLPDFLFRLEPKIEEVLEHYRVLIYWSVSNGSCVILDFSLTARCVIASSRDFKKRAKLIFWALECRFAVIEHSPDKCNDGNTTNNSLFEMVFICGRPLK